MTGAAVVFAIIAVLPELAALAVLGMLILSWHPHGHVAGAANSAGRTQEPAL